jgi:tetratricopeptide (TPR) repeat protein
VILNILAGNRHGADSALNIAFSVFPSPGLINLAAEYYYDFGDPQRSAELFSMLDGDAALGRQADALWLAGYRDSAREKWRMILSPHGVLEPDGSVVQPAMQDTALHSRALYNLAITEETPDEAEKLFTVLLQGIPPDLSGNGLPSGTANYSAGSEFIRQIGFIRYSRLKEAPKALEILETGKKQGGEGQPLIDLEIIKRRAEIEGPGRVIAETWILLGRYPAEENLYQWGAWYFDFQRNFTESGLLLKAAARQGFSGNRLGIHEGLRLIREGMLDAAEEKLAALPENSDTWAVLANRGRIFEASRAPARAIDCYAKAVEALLQNENYSEAGAKKASNIQVNIARCLKTTGKTDECRQALEKALELNAENLKARLELERL